MSVVTLEPRLGATSWQARRGSPRAASVFSLLALAGLGCGFPSPEACSLACGEDGACPGGFECQAQSLLCVPRGMTAACTPTEVRPVEPGDPAGDDDAGLGGRGPGPGPADAQAGRAGSSGGGADGAGGSAGGADGLSIVAVGAATDGACTGADLGGTLQARGGVGPYAWRVIEAPAGSSTTPTSDEGFELGGIPSELHLQRRRRVSVDRARPPFRRRRAAAAVPG